MIQGERKRSEETEIKPGGKRRRMKGRKWRIRREIIVTVSQRRKRQTDEEEEEEEEKIQRR